MQWDENVRTDVEVALNEAEVLGIRVGPAGGWCDLYLHVMALPETGPLESDARRIVRMARPAQVRVVLREERTEPAGYGPVIPLAGLDAVEDFFASLSWCGPMYGWKFLDDLSLAHDWPAQTSLDVDVDVDVDVGAGAGAGAGSHSLFWFSQCGRKQGDTTVAYCIEGTVTFEDLEILRADATPQSLEEFISEGRRYWQALHSGDERLSVAAQRAAQDRTPSWRP